MRKNITSKLAILVFCLSGILFISADLFYTSAAFPGHTGADGSTTCATAGCHSGNVLNATGGSVVITGLPDTYSPGTTYNFSVTISHGASRSKWGFAVKAIGTNNSNVGSFTTTNINAGSIGGGEIGHLNAPSQAGSTYTFNNLSWTAPAAPQSTEQTVRFFVVGNAANGIGSTGDFIYTTSKTITQQTSTIAESIPEVDKWVLVSTSNTATIQLSMKRTAVLQAAMYTMGGQEVARIASRQFGAGQHNLQFATGNLSTGTYVVTLISDNKKETKKIFIQK